MAGNRIKGLTIEIGADTKDLSKSLKGIDSSLNSTKRQLADVQKLLKLNPKNTELLKQKQDLLAKSIKDSKTRLDELKKAQKDLDAGGVDKNSEKYKALRREIIDTENQIKELNKASVADVGKAFDDLGNKFKTVGGALTKYVTGPILAIGGAALGAFEKVDAGIDIVVKKTGASGDTLTGFRDVMMDIATTIPATFEEAGEAVGEVATRFGLSGDELKTLSSLYIQFAKINDTTITASVDASQKALAAFGLSAQEAGGLLDTLTKVSQDTGISVDTLESGLVKNATAFQDMGLSIDDAAAMMGQIEKSGANVDTVLGGMSKALKNVTKDGGSMAGELAALEEKIKSGTDDVGALQTAYELFGKSGDQIFNAIKNGSLSFEALSSAATDAGGTVEGTFSAMTDPVDEFQTVLNHLIEVGYELGSALMPIISTLADSLIPVIQSVADWWNSLDEDVQQFIVTAGLVVAAVGPIISVIGTVIGFLGPLVTGIAGVITAGGALSALLTGPLSIAILGIITVGAALIANWDKVKEGAANLFNTVKEKWGGIKKAISDAIDGAKNAVKTGIDKIKSLFNFKFEWPKLKMPHFKVSGTLNPLEWLEKGMPKISVEWYAKGGIFNSPTIAGIGEAGSEAVLPLDNFYKRLDAALANQPRTVTNYVTVNASINSDGDAYTMARRVSTILTNELMQTARRW